MDTKKKAKFYLKKMLSFCFFEILMFYVLDCQTALSVTVAHFHLVNGLFYTTLINIAITRTEKVDPYNHALQSYFLCCFLHSE